MESEQSGCFDLESAPIKGYSLDSILVGLFCLFVCFFFVCLFVDFCLFVWLVCRDTWLVSQQKSNLEQKGDTLTLNCIRGFHDTQHFVSRLCHFNAAKFLAEYFCNCLNSHCASFSEKKWDQPCRFCAN